MDIQLEFAEESLTLGVQRLREMNEMVRVRELEVAEGADGLAESTDLLDSTRERLRSGAGRLRSRSDEFLADLDELESDVHTAVTVGRTSEPQARIASWRGTDLLTQKIAHLGEQVLLRWMHLDRIERLILQLMGEQDLKSIGVTQFPWPERRKRSSLAPQRRESRPRHWWPFGRSPQQQEADTAVEEALRVLNPTSNEERDPNDSV